MIRRDQEAASLIANLAAYIRVSDGTEDALHLLRHADAYLATPPAPAVKAEPAGMADKEFLRQAVIREINERMPGISRNFYRWEGWPGTWVFADVAVSALLGHVLFTTPPAEPSKVEACVLTDTQRQAIAWAREEAEKEDYFGRKLRATYLNSLADLAANQKG